jgi:hypothetical protein
MVIKTDSPAARRETLLKARLYEEIKAGIAASRDPTNAGLPDPTTRKTTTIYSHWYTRTCPECKHKFREGDRVRLCPQCEQAYHDDDQYHLYCWQKHFANDSVCRKERYDPIAEVKRKGCDYRWSGTFPDESEDVGEEALPARRVAEVTGQFLHGLENVWSPFGEEAVFEVEAGSPIVGHNCPWCRFQIRAGDRVVKCPCGKCDTYFHDDIFRHLTCWDDWNGSRGNDYCPTTGARIERPRQPIGAGGDNGS